VDPRQPAASAEDAVEFCRDLALQVDLVRASQTVRLGLYALLRKRLRDAPHDLPAQSALQCGQDAAGGRPRLGDRELLRLQTGKAGWINALPLDTEHIYTFTFHSMYLDIAKWEIVEVPGLRRLPLATFWGTADSLQVAAFGFPKGGGSRQGRLVYWDLRLRRGAASGALLHAGGLCEDSDALSDDGGGSSGSITFYSARSEGSNLRSRSPSLVRCSRAGGSQHRSARSGSRRSARPGRPRFQDDRPRQSCCWHLVSVLVLGLGLLSSPWLRQHRRVWLPDSPPPHRVGRFGRRRVAGRSMEEVADGMGWMLQSMVYPTSFITPTPRLRARPVAS